jgi:hypothetical protein
VLHQKTTIIVVLSTLIDANYISCEKYSTLIKHSEKQFVALKFNLYISANFPPEKLLWHIPGKMYSIGRLLTKKDPIAIF